jgi:hypothetical protein
MADTSTIPPDDPLRKLTAADPHGPGVRHVAVVGDTYSILMSRRTLLSDRHDCARRRRAAAAPSRFRRDVHVAGGRTRVHLSRRKKDRACGLDGQHSGQCAACVQERLWPRRAHALPVHAGRAGGVLHGDRYPLESRTSPRPRHDKAQMEERIKKAKAVAPQYRTELLIP